MILRQMSRVEVSQAAVALELEKAVARGAAMAAEASAIEASRCE